MKKELQNFYSFLSDNLKCGDGKYYIIEEINNKSYIKKVSIEKNGSFFVLKQKDQFKAELFKNAIPSCDFIVVSDDKVYFVELKSTSGDKKDDDNKTPNDETPRDKALKQCENSQLLFDYLYSAYNLQKSANLNFENKQFIYLYPKRAISEKSPTNMDTKNSSLIPKEVECDNNGCIELDLDFFKKIG
ncbi:MULTISPECIES: hypothetical protein [Campylobacter]|uniref:hypothetical protein n=1 Tax=Campylobacter TaxID=194 RepID=UPI000A358DEC|nr:MULTISPECIES: hypothetical protein [unclassified Campylobacter]MCR8678970.1 hypothetical protein [Campylobacter sp. RM19072]